MLSTLGHETRAWSVCYRLMYLHCEQARANPSTLAPMTYAHAQYDCNGEIVGSYELFYHCSGLVLNGWYTQDEDGINGPFESEHDAINSVTCFI